MMPWGTVLAGDKLICFVNHHTINYAIMINADYYAIEDLMNYFILLKTTNS